MDDCQGHIRLVYNALWIDAKVRQRMGVREEKDITGGLTVRRSVGLFGQGGWEKRAGEGGGRRKEEGGRRKEEGERMGEELQCTKANSLKDE